MDEEHWHGDARREHMDAGMCPSSDGESAYLFGGYSAACSVFQTIRKVT